jgi:hypothetical protein
MTARGSDSVIPRTGSMSGLPESGTRLSDYEYAT